MKTFDKIYTIVSQIPEGKVMTYKQVAKLSGTKNPRTVGIAMKINKDTTKVPCHRVVGSDGKLKGYAFGGAIKKKELLIKEGITFSNTHTVNLSKHLLSA